ncbi:MAG: alpha/beta hydrolase [Burkholderiales bacterium]|nr:alpha/beta hydrolase [Burkholderiales bacterium]
MHTPSQGRLLVRTMTAMLLFGSGLAVPSVAQEAQKPQVTDPVYTMPSQLVDVGHGRRMNIHCTGSGSPAVILEAGLGADMTTWALVQPKISAKTTACSYDRAGLGYSDASNRPSTVGHMVEDLHALLQAARVPPPYVLVGHSAAGMSIRVFADRYPDEVAGLVSVDSSHENQSTRFWAIGSGSKAQWDASLSDDERCVEYAKKGLLNGTPEYKKCVSDNFFLRSYFSDAINEAQERVASTVRYQAAGASENRAVFYVSADETRATRKKFGDMPIIALTHSPYPKNKDETQEERDKRTLLWEALHTEIAAMSTRGINVIVPNSGHYIQFDQPQIVVDAVNQAVTLAREWLIERSAVLSK